MFVFETTAIPLMGYRHLPVDEPIDLLNVAFENPRKIHGQSPGWAGTSSKKQRRRRGQHQELSSPSYSVPDRITGIEEVEELKHLCHGRIWNFVFQRATNSHVSI
jgi:hypothetical protein